MNILQFEETICRNCHKCIRHCGVKAIEYKDNRASIKDSDCILCGECVLVCPTHAKRIKNDIIYAKSLIERNDHVVVSLAPSYRAYFSVSFPVISRALKSLGFDKVEETVIGAGVVNEAYAAYIEANPQKHYITTSCYSTVLLVERYFPQLREYLLPVDSPLMAHAKMMKKAMPHTKVVFVGPCISKKAEAEEILNQGVIDAVLTFADIEEWMQEIGVEVKEADPNAVGISEAQLRQYPQPGGIIQTMPAILDACHPISVAGLQDCMDVFQALVDDPFLPSYFIEANICRHSCYSGPILRQAGKQAVFMSHQKKNWQEVQDTQVAASYQYKEDVNLHRLFLGKAKETVSYPEEEILAILHKTGKYTIEDELNCGACGYETCREKAYAVLEKKADINMCLPFFKKQAESFSNMIIDKSPNAIFVLKEDFTVLDLNPSAELLFGMPRKQTVNTVLTMFLREDCFEESKRLNTTIRKKLFFPEIDRICFVSATYIAEHRYYLAIIQDISKMEATRQAFVEMREQTLDATTQVIEKQMRVAQEIASLLGETTAQTKVTLMKLKRLLTEEEDKL